MDADDFTFHEATQRTYIDSTRQCKVSKKKVPIVTSSARQFVAFQMPTSFEALPIIFDLPFMHWQLYYNVHVRHGWEIVKFRWYTI